MINFYELPIGKRFKIVLFGLGIIEGVKTKKYTLPDGSKMNALVDIPKNESTYKSPKFIDANTWIEPITD